MANTYTISLPDTLKDYADRLATERRLSELIADLLEKQRKREEKQEVK